MNTMSYLTLLLCGILGIIAFTFVKIKKIRARNPVLTFGKTFYEYWRTDWDSIMTSLVAVFICLVTVTEYLKAQTIPSGDAGTFPVTFSYKVTLYVKTTFIVIGYAGNSIIDAFLGTTEAKLQKKADEGQL